MLQRYLVTGAVKPQLSRESSGDKCKFLWICGKQCHADNQANPRGNSAFR